MTTHELKEIYDLILAAYATQRQKLSADDQKQMARVYASGLLDLDAEAARAAVVRLIRTSKWIPTVAEIRDAAATVVHGHDRTGVEAWGEVHRAIRRYGSHRIPGEYFTFVDPITHGVVAALGWLDICASDHDMMAHFRARFIDAYEQLAKNRRQDRLASVTGGTAIVALEEPQAHARQDLEWRTPPQLASPGERSRELREVLHEANQNGMKPLKDFLPAHLVPADPVPEVVRGLHQDDCDCHDCVGGDIQ